MTAARQHSSRRVHDRGVNICVQGPHNETPAEIEACRRLGADIVCTAIYPEVVYYRELEMCYAGLSWVSDIAGMQDEKTWHMASPDEVAPIVRAALASLPTSADCRCRHTWDGDEGKLPAWYLAMR